MNEEIKLTKKGKPAKVGKPRGFASAPQRAAREAEMARRRGTSGSEASSPLGSPSAAEPVLRVLRPVEPLRGDLALQQGDGNEEAMAVAQVALWLAEPWTFVRDVFEAIPDFWQDEVLHALTQARTPAGLEYFKFCLKACKGPGKTCLLAWIIWWFMLTHAQASGFATSITGENLADNLWKELARWRDKSPMLTTLFGYQSDSIYAYSSPDTWFFSARTWPRDANAGAQASTLAGLHGPNTLLVLDEGGGIPVGVLVSGLAHHSTNDKSAAIPECHLTLLAGNPDTLDGALGWACTEDSASWWVKEITGDPDDPKRAPRIDVTWAREQIRIFGANNPWVLVNVFGKFPPSGYNKMLGPDQVRTAMHVRHPRAVWLHQPRIMSLDVARSTGRDRSALTRRQGPIVFPLLVYRLDDANELAGQVAFEYGRWRADMIIVDMVGVGGPVYDHLKAIGLPVIGFNGGLPARDPRFVDRRTETWWNMAQDVKGQGDASMLSLPNLPELVAEMTAPTIKFQPNGKMRLESKEDMLKRGISSPDLADSIAMTYAEPMAVIPRIPNSTMQALRKGVVVAEYDPFADSDVRTQEVSQWDS